MPSAWLSKSRVPDYFFIVTLKQLWAVFLVKEGLNSFLLFPPWWVYFVHPWNAVHRVALLDFNPLKKVDVACFVLNLYDLAWKMHNNLPWSEIFFPKYFLQNVSTWKFSVHTHLLSHVTIQNTSGKWAIKCIFPSKTVILAWCLAGNSALRYPKCALLTHEKVLWLLSFSEPVVLVSYVLIMP